MALRLNTSKDRKVMAFIKWMLGFVLWVALVFALAMLAAVMIQPLAIFVTEFMYNEEDTTTFIVRAFMAGVAICLIALSLHWSTRAIFNLSR